MRRVFTPFFRISYTLMFTTFLVLSTPFIGKAADAQPAPPAYTGRYQPTTVPSIPDDVYNKMSPDEQDEADEYLQAMDAENKNSFDLYGKVVDQNGQPVVGAKVRGNVLLSVSMVASASKDYFTTTDKNGEFNFTGLHGTSFGVAPSKDGYEYDSRRPPNWTKDYKPDPAHPMVFTLYKLQGAEPMIHTKFDSRVPYDGTSASFDLYLGKKSDAGDIKITLKRNPLQIRRGRDHFEWSIKIEVIAGGIVESHDSYPYEAPDKDYQPEFDFSQAKDVPNWTPNLLTTLYIHNGKGNYGRVNIDLAADSTRTDGTGFTVEAYINPSGSRNLEWDETKQVKP